MTRYAPLIAAAQAVVDRWDTPHHKAVEPTARVIERLRTALSALAPAPPSSEAPTPMIDRAEGERSSLISTGYQQIPISKQPGGGDVITPEHEVATIMDDGKAHQVLAQSLSGTTETCRFEDDGTVFIRRDGVLRAMRNAASYVAEQVAGFCGIFPGRDLIRRLDLGEATAPEQLEAAIRLRLMNKPTADFRGLRITLEVSEGGHVSTHTQGFNTTGNLTEGMLDAALKALTAEVQDFRRCPFHTAHSQHTTKEASNGE